MYFFCLTQAGCHSLSVLLFPRFSHVNRNTPALFDPLDLPVPERWLQVGAVQLHSQRSEAVRPAKGTRLEWLLLLLHVPWDVERVALAVAEAVDDGAAQAALMVHGLPQRLRLAPVALQVLPLSHHQGFLTGGQHFLFPSTAIRCVWAGFVERWDWTLRPILATLGCGTQHTGQENPKQQLTAHPERQRESHKH